MSTNYPSAAPNEAPRSGINSRTKFLTPLNLPSRCHDDHDDIIECNVSDEKSAISSMKKKANQIVYERTKSNTTNHSSSNLQFESNFEAGNLYKAELILPVSSGGYSYEEDELKERESEYDLYLQPDPMPVHMQVDRNDDDPVVPRGELEAPGKREVRTTNASIASKWQSLYNLVAISLQLLYNRFAIAFAIASKGLSLCYIFGSA
jgi:hypothetical protein